MCHEAFILVDLDDTIVLKGTRFLKFKECLKKSLYNDDGSDVKPCCFEPTDAKY